MKFISTRDKNNIVDSAFAIKSGIAKDGGLFVPDHVPVVCIEDLADMDYKEIAKYILGLYFTDFSKEQIQNCVDSAYGSNFSVPDMTNTVKLEDHIYITELFHGPTCAFKDMALQIMPYLLTNALQITEEKKTVVILTATSGDTGKAALDGFADVDGVKIIVFYPIDGVSNIQKLQMTTQVGNNVEVCAIRGNFDNAQTGVKEIFADKELVASLEKKGFMLSSANSINIARLIPQIIYYFHSYLTLVKQREITMGEKINFAVPTGNFGNILAAYFAKQMGLPVHKLICASNQNDVLTDFINTGIYNANRTFFTTSSPSMDILVSSNLERLLFELSDRNDLLIQQLMHDLKTNGCYRIPDALFAKLHALFDAGCCNNEETALCISEVQKKDGYVTDPHTAVAIDICFKRKKNENDGMKTVVMSTASPFKFCESVLAACKLDYMSTDEFAPLDTLSNVFNLKIPDGLSCLKTAKIRFRNVVNQEDMTNVVTAFIKKQGGN